MHFLFDGKNTATMQTLVIAHAAFGHNHFFKKNYLFKQGTDAEGILDYLDFAKSYVAQCEERHVALREIKVIENALGIRPLLEKVVLLEEMIVAERRVGDHQRLHGRGIFSIK